MGTDMKNGLTPAEIEQLSEQLAHRIADRLSDRPRLVDRNELSNILGVSVPTVERLMKNSRIPVIRIGRSVRFDPARVIEHLSNHQ